MQARSTVANEEGEDGHGWDHAGWSYDGPTGPQYWGTLAPDYAQCSSGTSLPAVHKFFSHKPIGL